MEEEQIQNKLDDFRDVIKNQSEAIIDIEKRQRKIEGLDLSKYLKEENESDEVIDERIANLLEIANKLHNLNKYKRDAILDYMAKKSKVNKTDIKKVVEAFEQYLEKLL